MRGVLFFLVSSASARSTFFFLLAQRGSRGVPLQATYSLTKIVDLWHTIPCLLFLFRPNFHSLKISHSAKLFTARYRLSRTSYSGFKLTTTEVYTAPHHGSVNDSDGSILNPVKEKSSSTSGHKKSGTAWSVPVKKKVEMEI